MAHSAQTRLRLQWLVLGLALTACGSDDSHTTKQAARTPTATGGSAASTAAPISSGASGSSAVVAGGVGGTSAPAAVSGGAGTTTPIAANGGPGSVAMPLAGSGTKPAGGPASGAPGGSVPVVPMTPFTGPLDGDPAKPMVAIPDVPCGVPRIGFNTTPPSVKITNRDVVVAYPCAHEGAAVTFFLFIHGTLQEAQKVAFTMNAFPIHNSVDSHNVIVVVPKAVGTQWGNGDNGADAPHLAEVVDWVYATFGQKFNIRSMWASGGSWGAFYLGNTFACDPKYESRLRGVRMVVGGGCPRCSSRLSCIVAQQELELGMDMPLTDEAKEMATVKANVEPYAMMHGCDAKMGPTNLGPVRAWTWPNCDPGWVHSYYLGPGQHADPWNDPTALTHMVDEIKSIEK